MIIAMITLTVVALTPSIISRFISAKCLGLEIEGIYRFIFLYGIVSYMSFFIFTYFLLVHLYKIGDNNKLLIILTAIIFMVIIAGYHTKKDLKK